MAAPATEAREALVGLTSLTREEVRAIVAELRRMDLSPERVRDALLDLLPEFGTEYHLAAAALAADWYDDLRDAEAVRGRFRADPVPPPTPARWEALVRWGIEPLFRPEPDWDAATGLLEGGAQRTVADGHRLTVVENTKRDPQAKGWRRVGDGSSCAFCRLLISRGAVYSKDTVTFKSHDHCGCSAAPSWDEGATVSTLAYRASERRITDADRARLRAYLREHDA